MYIGSALYCGSFAMFGCLFFVSFCTAELFGMESVAPAARPCSIEY